MELSIIQAILIGLWTAFCLSGMLLGIYSNRCIVLSFGVGLITGDMQTALSVECSSELAYMGFGVSTGGSGCKSGGPGIFGTLWLLPV